jgi:hypothetical protein
MGGPAAKLLLIFGSQLGIVVPFIAEAVRRTCSERHIGTVGFADSDLGHPLTAIEKREP